MDANIKNALARAAALFIVIVCLMALLAADAWAGVSYNSRGFRPANEPPTEPNVDVKVEPPTPGPKPDVSYAIAHPRRSKENSCVVRRLFPLYRLATNDIFDIAVSNSRSDPMGFDSEGDLREEDAKKLLAAIEKSSTPPDIYDALIAYDYLRKKNRPISCKINQAFTAWIQSNFLTLVQKDMQKLIDQTSPASGIDSLWEEIPAHVEQSIRDEMYDFGDIKSVPTDPDSPTVSPKEDLPGQEPGMDTEQQADPKSGMYVDVGDWEEKEEFLEPQVPMEWRDPETSLQDLFVLDSIEQDVEHMLQQDFPSIIPLKDLFLWLQQYAQLADTHRLLDGWLKYQSFFSQNTSNQVLPLQHNLMLDLVPSEYKQTGGKFTPPPGSCQWSWLDDLKEMIEDPLNKIALRLHYAIYLHQRYRQSLDAPPNEDGEQSDELQAAQYVKTTQDFCRQKQKTVERFASHDDFARGAFIQLNSFSDEFISFYQDARIALFFTRTPICLTSSDSDDFFIQPFFGESRICAVHDLLDAATFTELFSVEFEPALHLTIDRAQPQLLRGKRLIEFGRSIADRMLPLVPDAAKDIEVILAEYQGKLYDQLPEIWDEEISLIKGLSILKEVYQYAEITADKQPDKTIEKEEPEKEYTNPAPILNPSPGNTSDVKYVKTHDNDDDEDVSLPANFDLAAFKKGAVTDSAEDQLILARRKGAFEIAALVASIYENYNLHGYGSQFYQDEKIFELADTFVECELSDFYKRKAAYEGWRIALQELVRSKFRKFIGYSNSLKEIGWFAATGWIPWSRKYAYTEEILQHDAGAYTVAVTYHLDDLSIPKKQKKPTSPPKNGVQPATDAKKDETVDWENRKKWIQAQKKKEKLTIEIGGGQLVVRIHQWHPAEGGGTFQPLTDEPMFRFAIRPTCDEPGWVEIEEIERTLPENVIMAKSPMNTKDRVYGAASRFTERLCMHGIIGYSPYKKLPAY